jgi:P2-like prophage tail protein X
MSEARPNDTYERIVIEGEGLTLSLLVWRRFRRPMPGLVERVLDENRHLADLGPILPLGTEVLMPIPASRPVNVVAPVTLWT